MKYLHFLNSQRLFFFHGKLAAPILQDCQLNKQIAFISLRVPFEVKHCFHPTLQSPAQLNLSCQSCGWDIIRENRVVVGMTGR